MSEKEGNIFESAAEPEINQAADENSRNTQDAADVYLCYLTANENGEKTEESRLASEIAVELEKAGCRVISSGSARPDQTAAQSAKVMVVIGTKPESFEAEEVKKEWLDFLKCAQNSGQKTLIPACLGVRAEELPKEFAPFEARNMAQMSFLHNLLVEIGELCGKRDEAARAAIAEPKRCAEEPLIKRSYFFLEDNDWVSANRYAERALDINPENADAYVAKLLADAHCPSLDALESSETQLEGNADYEKALRFAQGELKTRLQKSPMAIEAFIRQNRLQSAYEAAASKAESAKTEEAFIAAAEMFAAISEYGDAEARAAACREKAQLTRYERACAKMRAAGTEADFLAASEAFAALGEFGDAADQAKACLERGRTLEKENAYQAAEALFEKSVSEEDFRRAGTAYEKAKGYRDADEKAKACLEKAETTVKEAGYQAAQETMRSAESAEAMKGAAEAFRKLSGYRDAEALAEACDRRSEEITKNMLLEAARQYQEMDTYEALDQAVELFGELAGWKDANKRLSACKKRMKEIRKLYEEESREEDIIIPAEKTVKVKRKRKGSAGKAFAAVLGIGILMFMAYAALACLEYRNFAELALKEWKQGAYDTAWKMFVSILRSYGERILAFAQDEYGELKKLAEEWVNQK